MSFKGFFSVILSKATNKSSVELIASPPSGNELNEKDTYGCDVDQGPNGTQTCLARS